MAEMSDSDAVGSDNSADTSPDNGNNSELIERISRSVCHEQWGDPDALVMNPAVAVAGPMGSTVVTMQRPAWQLYALAVSATIEYLTAHGMMVAPDESAVPDTRNGQVESPPPRETTEDWRMRRGLRDMRVGGTHPKAV